MMKLSFALLTIFMSTIGISFAQGFSSVHLDDTSANVLPTNVIWAKTYGGSTDDRAFYALPVQDGCLVVGSSMSVIENSIVGWILRLDGEGNALWNRTFLNGDGDRKRTRLNS